VKFDDSAFQVVPITAEKSSLLLFFCEPPDKMVPAVTVTKWFTE